MSARLGMSYLAWWRRLLPFAPSPGGQHDGQDAAAVGTLDHLRSVFWQGYRHLFPPHALATQMPNGSIVVSWAILDEPNSQHPYAAPVVLRFDEALVDAMSKADPLERLGIAQQHEATLREGLRGYDPFARFPNARVVNIG
jgi:hypothetical protein